MNEVIKDILGILGIIVFFAILLAVIAALVYMGWSLYEWSKFVEANLEVIRNATYCM